MPKNSRENKEKKFHKELISQMLTLATAGFGLVAALAWNNLIQEFVGTYVKRWLPADGKLISGVVKQLLV